MALTILGLAVNDILSIKKRGIGADGFVSEIYSAAAGEAGLIDTTNTTGIYISAIDCYGQGVVQTNKLYHSDTAITTLKVNDIRKGTVATGATVDVSFDDGSSWSTATNQMNTNITSFTGTASDGSTYKLKLKFTLGSTYDSATDFAWVTTSSGNVVKGSGAGFGTTSDALCFGGYSAYPGESNSTEKWSGSSWVTTTNMTEATVYLAGCGITSAGLCFGGDTGADIKVSATYKWTGSTWSTTPALTEVKGATPGGCGTTSAALCVAGNSGTAVDTTEKWTGTWATTTVLTNATNYHTACGTTTAALQFGGNTGANSNQTNKWSGSIWATTTALNTAKAELSSCGTTSAALCIGGIQPLVTAVTEKWDGSTWATTTSLTKTMQGHSGCGTTTAALSMFGHTGAYSVQTERWLGTGLQKGFAAKIN
jgi:large repetitive protein